MTVFYYRGYIAYKKEGDINRNGLSGDWKWEGPYDDGNTDGSTEWVSANIYAQNGPCPLGYAPYLYACGGDSPDTAIDGKYELVGGYVINGYPYYKYVGDGVTKSPKNELAFYWEPHSGTWFITTDLVKRYGMFYTVGYDKGKSWDIKDWKVAPEKLYIPVRDR